MDVAFGWFLVSTFLSKIIQVESYLEIKVGHFHVLQKHPRIRQCAKKALQQNEYVGARISDETGDCEGLPHSWGTDPTIESGYGYVRKVNVHVSYEPAAKIKGKYWIIPGVLDKGAKLDMHVTWGNTKQDITFKWISCSHAEYDDGGTQQGLVLLSDLQHNFGPSLRQKISFVAKGNILRASFYKFMWLHCHDCTPIRDFRTPARINKMTSDVKENGSCRRQVIVYKKNDARPAELRHAVRRFYDRDYYCTFNVPSPVGVQRSLIWIRTAMCYVYLIRFRILSMVWVS